MNKNITDKTIIASLEVDPQRSFTPLCPDELPVPEGDQIADALNEQADVADLRIVSKEVHPPNAFWIADENHKMLEPVLNRGPHVDVYWPAHCIAGTKGCRLIPGLPDMPLYDFIVYKGIEPYMHPYGACFQDGHDSISTGLIEFLKINEVTGVVVGGLATDYCVRTTVLQLRQYCPEIVIFLNLSACRGLKEESSSKAIKEMKEKGTLIINSANDIP